jgi:hypothetical protein
MKGFVSSVIDNMIVITLCVATFFFAPNFGAKAYAQENNTLILEDIRAILRDEQRDISSIRNISSAELEASIQMELATSKLEAQGAYTALSVFLLGSGLVIFGLRLTIKSSRYVGKFFTLMVWALTLPVCILIGLYQYGIITGNNLLASFVRNEEPFYLLSFLLYVPIGIVNLYPVGTKKDYSRSISSGRTSTRV